MTAHLMSREAMTMHLMTAPVVTSTGPVSAAPAGGTHDLGGVAGAAGVPGDCQWWNLACQGAEQAANAGMSAITQSIAAGAQMLMGVLVRELDASAGVPLEDPIYRGVYVGFLGLAAPLIAIVLLVAVVLACLRRDAGTLGRAVVGVGVAGLGGAFYIVLAQLLVAVDDWLSRGVVRVTGYDFARSIEHLAVGFESVAGNAGEYAANMLLLLLMMIMLIAAVILWFVMIFRKIAILVVVAFAPLLIAGFLWAPTRRWVVRLTEVLIALVFTKTAIFTLFGVGLALLSRGADESVGDFVGATVLMCGACFTPILLLRLVHFAADTQLAGDALKTLHGGTAPVTGRAAAVGGALGGAIGLGRHDHARSQGQAPPPDDQRPLAPDANPESGVATHLTGTSPSTAAGAGAGAGADTASSGAAAAGAVGPAAAGVIVTKAAADTARAGFGHATDTAEQFHASIRGHFTPEHDAPYPTSTRRGPTLPTHDDRDGGRA